jgi:cysteine-rich repeat protein
MRKIEHSTFLAFMGLFTACPGSNGGSTLTSASTASSTVDTMVATTTATTMVATGPATSTSTTPPTTGTTHCPNGIVDDGEACDDGNMINGDGCNNDCTESGALLWEYKSGIPGVDEVRDIAIDGDAGIVVGGGQNSDRWIAHFSKELAPNWSEVYDGAPIDIILSVAVSPDGIFAAGALTPMPGPDPETQIRTTSTARLTHMGEVSWEDIWVNDLGDVYPTQIALAEDGDVVIAGMMAVAADNIGVFARRYSAAGAEKWTANHPINYSSNALYPLGPGLAVGPDTIYVGYNIMGVNGFEESLIGFPPSGGNALWVRKTSETPGVIYSIVRDLNGDVVVGGSGNSFMEMTVRRLTSAADPIWSSTGCTGKVMRAVAIDMHGDIVTIGDGPGDLGVNIRLCRFTSDGTLRWGRDIDGGVGDDRGYAVAVLPSGEIVAGGKVSAAANETDAWLAVYSP